LFGGKFEGYLNESEIKGVETESDIKTKKADECYKECNGDCIVEGTIRRYPWCDYCKKLLDKRDIPEKILVSS